MAGGYGTPYHAPSQFTYPSRPTFRSSRRYGARTDRSGIGSIRALSLSSSDTAIVDEGETLLLEESVLLLNYSDSEGTLKISDVGEAVNGTVRLVGTTVIYVHDGSETTAGAFVYTVSDGVDTATATVTIDIRRVNDPPTAVDDSAVLDEGGTLQIQTRELLSNDSDAEGGALKISAVGEAVDGTVRLDGTAVTYVHDGSETIAG